jgi:glycerophosphoryl diester phosphodiesterase
VRLGRQHNPRLRTAAILAAVAGNELALDVGILSARRAPATPDFIRAAHRANKEAHVGGADDPHQMRRLIERGVDDIIPDYPARLNAVCSERAARGPVERMLLACRYLLD